MIRKRILSVLIAVALLAPIAIINSPARAAPTVIDFESFATGTLLTSQLSGQGVTFPQGLEVYQCEPSSCIAAHSGTKVVHGQFAGEFQRDPFEAVFTTPQKQVSLWVRSDAQFTPTKNIIATMNAYNESGNPVGSQTKNFSSGAGWQQLTVGNLFGSATIKRVVVSGGQDDFAPTNFLAYDDLSFEGGADPEPSPSPDTSPPNVTISSPAGDPTIRVRQIFVEVTVADDTGIFSVVGDISGSSGVVATMDFCGSTFSGTCPASPTEFSQAVSLPDAPNGSYQVRIEACDPSLNCRTGIVPFTLEVIEPTASSVFIHRVEANQAVQARTSTLPHPSDPIPDVHPGVHLVAEKSVLIRAYPLGVGGTDPNYSARLRLRIERRDGTTLHRTIAPNAGPTSVAVQQDPVDPDARRDAVTLMRSKPGTSLNYVIPEEFLGNARIVDMKFRRGARDITGTVRLRFSPPARIFLNVVDLTGTLISGTPPGNVQTNIIDYLEAALPVADVTLLSRRRLTVFPDVILTDIMGDCGYALWTLWSAYGTDDAPARPSTSAPNVVPTLGIIPTGAFGSTLGCAYIGGGVESSSGLSDIERVGGSAITETWGDVAAQEIGHTLGLIHAGNSHGESSGGSAESTWYPHGSLGERNYGVILAPASPPGDADFGTWSFLLIDPCPTTDDTQRVPNCTIPATSLPHDFMSYGSSSTNLGSLVTSGSNWISDITSDRINSFIVHDVPPRTFSRTLSAAAAVESSGRVDALLIDGVVDEFGNATLLPILRKDLPASLTEPGEPGPYRLRLLDGSGGVLATRSFDVMEVTDHGTHFHLFRQAVPFVDGVARVVVERDGDPLLDEVASENAPTVEITAPGGGEIFPDGVLEVAWQASDADGDALRHLVQFSPDGGSSWQGLQLVTPGQPLQATVDVSELITGRHGLIRVVASDGINTGEDTTEVFFSVGTDAQPAKDNLVDRELSLRIRAARRRAIGALRAPDGPPSCIEDMRVKLKRNGDVIKRGFTNFRGKVRFRLPNQRGRYQLVAPRRRAALLVCRPVRSPVRRFKPV